jgi:glycosyltransferase involved in cell wall biosynthesis
MVSFSTLMSVYKKDDPFFLKQALQSLKDQALRPSEVVIVKDGLLTAELNEVLNEFEVTFTNVHLIPLPQNKGLGNALSIGLEACNNDIVTRMDADDIAHPDRFLKQINYLASHNDVAVLGCNLQEFNKEIGDIERVKKVPALHSEVKKYARFRNPLNHPSVVFRKSVIEKVGSYKEMPLFEDYYLWLRVLKAGYKVENLNECLLYFRVGNQALTRRHGFGYIKKELHFFVECAKEKLIPAHLVIFIFFVRFPLRLLPKKLFLNLYQHLLRT